MDVSRPSSPHPARWPRLLFLWGLFHGACAHPAQTKNKELWVPASDAPDAVLEGRELWIDVELSGYTRQRLERISDYEAEHDDTLPAPRP